MGSVYVILIDIPLQQWLRERATYIAYLICYSLLRNKVANIQVKHNKVLSCLL